MFSLNQVFLLMYSCFHSVQPCKVERKSTALVHLSITLLLVCTMPAKSQDFLSCYYFNATSISGVEKMMEFNHSFSGESYDVISVSETWFHEGIYDAGFLPNCRYEIYRHDRDEENSHEKSGGGVMLCINKIYPLNDVVT